MMSCCLDELSVLSEPQNICLQTERHHHTEYHWWHWHAAIPSSLIISLPGQSSLVGPVMQGLAFPGGRCQHTNDGNFESMFIMLYIYHCLISTPNVSSSLVENVLFSVVSRRRILSPLMFFSQTPHIYYFYYQLKLFEYFITKFCYRHVRKYEKIYAMLTRGMQFRRTGFPLSSFTCWLSSRPSRLISYGAW